MSDFDGKSICTCFGWLLFCSPVECQERLPPVLCRDTENRSKIQREFGRFSTLHTLHISPYSPRLCAVLIFSGTDAEIPNAVETWATPWQSLPAEASLVDAPWCNRPWRLRRAGLGFRRHPGVQTSSIQDIQKRSSIMFDHVRSCWIMFDILIWNESQK